MYTATYSPEDNKLRLYASTRLDAETYARVKSAGFSWAPRQELFVAPMWTPEREDLLLELAGEIGDEDSSLVDRAEERAERFEDYSDNRAKDAELAKAAVDRIADGIPLGQPILVGHHSERHARKDAEKIENGMRRAVKMWETSQYWKSRAAGAIRAAKYKERPDVRARRIKGIEADIRSQVASYTPHEDMRPIMQQRWNAGPDAPEIPHVWVGPHGRGGHWVAEEDLPRIKARSERWLRHLENRLEYERAMLAESGGLKAEGFDIQVGGRVLRRGEWLVVTKLNKRDDALMSVTVLGHWASTVPIEEVQDYRPPAEGDAEKVKAVTKQAPLCNFRSEGCKEATAEQWKQSQRISDSYFVHTFPATDTTGAYRHRTCHGPNWTRVPVFLTDSKIVLPPTLKPAPAPVSFVPVENVQERPTPVYRAPEPTPFDAMKESLKAGVQVVSAPQLFPTPPDLAARMVEIADVNLTDRVLEPSAGTGVILRAIGNAPDKVAVEINPKLVQLLARFGMSGLRVHQADFLECNGDLGTFDIILMNPPFAMGQDIKHITHAVKFLRPGGRLVAICANGPTRHEKLKPLADEWYELPADTFKEAGTGVNTAMLVIRRGI